MSNLYTTMNNIIKKEFERRLITEGLSRIDQCLNTMSEDNIWYKHNSNTNSVGNLILHLTGNVRQYILSGIGGQKDIRERPKEFLIESRIDKSELLNRLRKVILESNDIVKNLTGEEMIETRKVQGFDESVLSIIIHVIEHFSYHVGQITFFTKYIEDVDTGYYAGLNLNITE